MLGILDALTEPAAVDALAPAKKLVEQDLLVVEGSDLDVADAAVDTWKWRQDARFFHFSTQHAVFETSVSKQGEDLRARAAAVPPPSPFKSYDVADRVALDEAPPAAGHDVWDVLARRRTVRELIREPITFRQLSAVVRWTWGASRVVEDPGVGTHLLKTSPSGGARHPIEVYPLVMRVEGVRPGIYHYAVETNELELLREGYLEDLAMEICAGQPWIGDSAVVFFMTAVLERSMWKYDHSRTYRILLMDAGHLGQTFHLVCTALGLGPLTTAATNDLLLQEVLGIDGAAEIPLYVAAVGRPRPPSTW